MLPRIVSLVAAFVMLATVGAARAGTLSYSNFTVIDPQQVTVSGEALGRQETGVAGEIQLLWINGGTGTLSTFCIDVADWLTKAGQFSTGTYLTGSLADQINALMTNVLPTLGQTPDASAALQVAIWETEYGANLTVNADANILGLASTYIGDVRSGSWTANPLMQVAVLGGGGVDQSQAYLAPVPEPTSLAVLGMALLTIVVLRYRRRMSDATAERFQERAGYSRLARVSINCRPPRRPLN